MSGRSVFKILVVLVVSVLLVSSLVCLSELVSFQQAMFTPANYSAAVSKLNAYDRSITFLTMLVQQQVPPEFSAFVGPGFASDLVKNSFERSWFDSQVNGVFTGFFDFLSGKSDRLSLTVSFVVPKQKMASFLQARLGSYYSTVAPALNFDQFPDSVPLMADQLAAESDVGSALASLKTVYSGFNLMLVFLVLVLLVCVGILLWLVKSVKKYLVLGIVFFLSGILLVITYLAAASFASFAAGELFETGFVSVAWFSVAEVSAAIAVFSNAFASWTLLFIGLYCGLGILLLIAFFMLRSQKPPVSPSVSPVEPVPADSSKAV